MPVKYMSATKTWKVCGENGQQQQESFNKSYIRDFSDNYLGTRIIEVFNSDLTGTNEFSVVRITRNTYKECDDELSGQVTDGIFENYEVGDIFELNIEATEKLVDAVAEWASWNDWSDYDFIEALKSLGIDYVDMLLVGRGDYATKYFFEHDDFDGVLL